MEKTYVNCTSAENDLGNMEIEELFLGALSKALADINNAGKVIIIPPDFTRIHSRSGLITEMAAKYLKDRLGAVLPAIGTHIPMNKNEISLMFGKTPSKKFLVHSWRNDIKELGRLDANKVEKITEGSVRYDWPSQVNKLLHKDNCNFSLIISIGQVVPHEVAGMANHIKNIFIGTGGKEAIDKSHFAGAAYGMERIMGKTQTPVRALFDEGLNLFGAQMPPILWVLTVIDTKKDGNTAVRGLFIGFGRECFEKAAAFSQEINVNLLESRVNKMVVYLNPDEFRTTWLGNKAIYRTRMAVADGGELLILAPALERFGEDLEIDRLIRKYGYRPREEIIKMVNTNTELKCNLSAAAHMIHGSGEGRFNIRYCTSEKLSRGEIEAVGFKWGDIQEALSRYCPSKLSSGWNTLEDGEKIFYIPNPALGLWAENSIF